MRGLFAACAAVALGLSGCGGGGSDSPALSPPAASPTPPPPAPSPPPPPPAPPPSTAIPAPSGLYLGTTNVLALPEIQLLALENGIVWAVYGATTNGTLSVTNVLNANGTAANGSYSASDVRDYAADRGGARQLFVTALSGPFTAGGTWSGSVDYGVTLPQLAASVGFTAQKVPSSSYDYEAPAQLSSIAGSWSGTDLLGVATAVSISAAGDVAGNSNGCAFVGTAAPRPSGKNVFDVSVTFANDAACASPGARVSGVGLTYATGTGSNRLLVTVQTTDRNQGYSFVAVR